MTTDGAMRRTTDERGRCESEVVAVWRVWQAQRHLRSGAWSTKRDADGARVRVIHVAEVRGRGGGRGGLEQERLWTDGAAWGVRPATMDLNRAVPVLAPPPGVHSISNVKTVAGF